VKCSVTPTTTTTTTTKTVIHECDDEYPPDDHGLAVSSAFVLAGDTESLSAGCFAPGSTESIELHSKSVTLGAVIADAQGDIKATVTIPVDFESGQHLITVAGPS